MLEELEHIIGNPEEFFRRRKKEKVRNAIFILLTFPIASFLGIFVLVSVIGQAYLSYIELSPYFPDFFKKYGALIIGFGVASGYYLFLVINTVFLTFLFHIFLKWLGARKGLGETFKALVYSSMPVYLLSWIPFLNLIAYFWMFYLAIKGASVLHGTTEGRALLSLIFGILSLIAVISLIAKVA